MKHFQLALGLATLAISTAAAHAQSPIANPQDLPRLYAEAMAASDVEAIVSFYAPNAIVMTPEGPVAAGADQIRALMSRNFAGGAKLSMTFNQAQLDGGNGHAVTVWDWTLAVVLPDQQQPLQRHVRSMLYLKQQGESWSITADMYQILPQ
jgi:uncharacterized protein (TIGR02246 family)